MLKIFILCTIWAVLSAAAATHGGVGIIDTKHSSLSIKALDIPEYLIFDNSGDCDTDGHDIRYIRSLVSSSSTPEEEISVYLSAFANEFGSTVPEPCLLWPCRFDDHCYPSSCLPELCKAVDIEITPKETVLFPGQTLQYRAIGSYPHDKIEDITERVAWSSSAPLVASISNTPGLKGQVISHSVGKAFIKAEVDYLTASKELIIVDAPPHRKFKITANNSRQNLLEFKIDASGIPPYSRYSFIGTVTNNEGINPPQGVVFDEQDGTFSWRPTPSQTGEYFCFFHLTGASIESTLRIIQISVSRPEICTGSSEACLFVDDKYEQGIAAGNIGDWYHNCDKFHAALNLDEFPQVDLMASPEPVFNASDKIVVGNASVRVSGVNTMSVGRSILSNSEANSVYQQYINNNYYWYPAVDDHEDIDYYHGKVPFAGNSQGRSGSELDEVRSFLYGLAAFKPSVKEELIANGLLMPTMQMIFRRIRVDTDEQYLAGTAHPSAFDNFDSALLIAGMANDIDLDSIPPMIQLEVKEENYSAVNGKKEQWFDTPVSICRIFRGLEYSKRIIISADKSYDLNELHLTYHWRVLRGDPEHVRIKPLNHRDSTVEIQIDYHPKTAIANSIRLSNMVEVGAFVHNGRYYSAPGFITSFTLDNEERTYNQEGDLLELKHNNNYVDPTLR